MVYVNGLHFRGDLNGFLQGNNLHLLMPFIAADAVPNDIFEAEKDVPFMPTIFRSPQEVKIAVFFPDGPPATLRLKGLGRALTFPIPNGSVGRFFLLEGKGFAALHRQEDFWFLGQTGAWDKWHLVFKSQSYELLFSSKPQRDRFAAEVRRWFPDPQRPEINVAGTINILSAYDEPAEIRQRGKTLPRFRANDIIEIARDKVDLGNPVIMSPKFSPSSFKMETRNRASPGFGLAG